MGGGLAGDEGEAEEEALVPRRRVAGGAKVTPLA